MVHALGLVDLEMYACNHLSTLDIMVDALGMLDIRVHAFRV
jgi:hypothetical protein